MASMGVWKVSNPFHPNLKSHGFENGSYLEAASNLKDGLAISESGRSLKVQSEVPHLVSLGGGRLSTAITIHPLPEGRIFVGSPDALPPKDIIIHAPGIERDHCFIDNDSGIITIHPQLGDVSIDGVHVTQPTCLSQGCMLCLGHTNYFRFNNPEEAYLMRQISPSQKSQNSSSFVPEESVCSSQPSPYDVPRSFPDHRYFDGIDLVEKISKYEYLSHSQPPVVTSQDTPKYFVNEGIRILHSAPPVHKGYSSEISLNPESAARHQNHSHLGSKPGFFTPPPYPHYLTPTISMSPKPKLRTPDPSMNSCCSERCTPTTPNFSYSSRDASSENLKACEIELQEQHRKAVQERLRDQEQEKQERMRLEEILHMCAEYTEKSHGEPSWKPKNIHNRHSPAPHSASLGEIDSNGVYPCTNGAVKYTTLPAVTVHKVPDAKVIGHGFISPGGSYYTIPNRIKTNGSLPRERNQFSANGEVCQLSPQTYVQHISGDMTYPISMKALNSASSEDELCAIMESSLKPSPGVEVIVPGSVGTNFVVYPQSPRTRIKTVLNQQDMNPIITVENRPIKSDVPDRKSLTLTLPGTPQQPVNALQVKVLKEMDANYRTPEQVALEIEAEINKLQKEKQSCLQAITGIKYKVSELDCQKNEALNELELEHALVAGELKDKEQLQIFEVNKMAELQNKKISIERKFEMVQKELEVARCKVQQQELLVQDMQDRTLQPETLHQDDMNLRLDELKAQQDLLEIERKAFEDLEFQQYESQAHDESERDELGHEIACFRETVEQRQIELGELNKQKLALSSQMEMEKIKCDDQLKVFTEELRQEISNLELLNGKLKSLFSARPGITPCSSPENSPRTSDSDIELLRNGAWNVQAHLRVDETSVCGRMPSDRSENCNSFHSFESESSSLTSSDTGCEPGRRPEDKGRTANGVLESNMVLQKERALQSSYQEHAPLVSQHHENGNVKLRDKPRSQRPLTRYLPVRNTEFDLRQHIETAGHQIEVCMHLHLTATSCHGYLHKLGSAWKSWRKRWFVFDRIQKALLYYSDRGETKLRGGINFETIEEVYVDHLQSVKSPNPHSTFCVKTYDRVYYLMAPTPEAMRIWVDVIFTGAEGYQDFLEGIS